MKRTVVITILVLLFMFSSVSINYAETVNEKVEDINVTDESISDINEAEENNSDINIESDTNINEDIDIDDEENIKVADTENQDAKENSAVDTSEKTVEQRNYNTSEEKLVLINNQWRVQVNGIIDYDYEGIVSNENGTWYVNKTINFNYTGTYFKDNKAYIIEKSKLYLILPKDATIVSLINNKWRMIINGEVDYNYTGIGENENGKWYVKDGTIDFKYNGIFTDSTGSYIVERNKINDVTMLMLIENKWRMVVHGKIDYDYEGIVSNENGTWYVNKTIDFNYTGTYFKDNKAYIIEKSKLYLTLPKDATIVSLINNKWRMVINGEVDYNYTGIGENENGKWCIKDGILDFKCNGIFTDSTGSYLVERNKVNDITILMLIENKWRMVVHGKIDYDYEGIVSNENGTWYVNKTIDFNYTGTYFKDDKAYIIEKSKLYLTLPKNTTIVSLINNKWRMVINGEVDYNYTGIGENENGKWCIKDGILDFKCNGIFTDSTGSYLVERNKVNDITMLMLIENKWRMVVHGKIDYDYEGIVSNENGTWYVNKTIDFNYTGTYFKDDKAYIIEKSKLYLTLPKNTTIVSLINNKWRMVINGEVDYNYTGIGENENGKWYVKDGTIDFKYNSQCTDKDGIVYNIVNNKLEDILSVPGYPATMTVSGPNKGVKYLSDAISIEGWALSLEKNDKILIYIDGKYVGEATREQNEEALLQDTNNEFGGIDSNPLPGFYFNLSSLRLKVGDHRLKIVNVASDGKTIMQTREIDFNIFALTKSRGIDVSNHQGIIDWNAVKNSGVTFAIIKIGEYWPNSKKILYDRYFERNYSECRRLGIAVGGYVYTYAFNSAEAALDAQVCLDRIAGKRFDLPIYYDIEDPSIVRAVESGETNANMLTDAVLTFCNIIKNAGYQSGVYTYLNFFERFLNAPLLEKYCSIWVAQWGNRNDYKGKYDFWQYSSDGSVPGINGRVDLDWYYPKK